MQLVVGAAILDGGKVLAARRTRPTSAAGRWELPGGKVEPGESPDDALAREIQEELGCSVGVGDWLDRSVSITPELTLRVALAHVVRGEPTPVEHDQLRWLGADELDDVDWLEADRPFLPQLRAQLRAQLRRPRPRGVFDDRDVAESVAVELRSEGYAAWTEREPFAGEDDDQDHLWAVLTDGPDVRLELLVETHDGWYDDGEPTAAATPLRLPQAPRR